MTPQWEGAIRSGDLATLRDLADGDPDHIDSVDRYGQTGLMVAAHAGHLDLVRFLVESDADLDRTGKYGLSALMLAIVAGHREVARHLAGAGADMGLRGSGAPGFAGRTAADLARERGWHDLADELAREGGRDGEHRPSE